MLELTSQEMWGRLKRVNCYQEKHFLMPDTVSITWPALWLWGGGLSVSTSTVGRLAGVGHGNSTGQA